MLAGLLCWGCKQTDVTQVLDRAETCMAERPDSSLYLLRTLDKRHISGSLRKARYALLYSQALDKNYIDVDNDSLIRVAVDYYKGHGTSHEKALRWLTFISGACTTMPATKRGLPRLSSRPKRMRSTPMTIISAA
jgi:tetratricopeptide repeat protein